MYFEIYEFVKFGDFTFISVFTRFASFATFIKLHVSRPNLSGVHIIFHFRNSNLTQTILFPAYDFAFLYFYAAIFTRLLEPNLIKILSLFV